MSTQTSAIKSDVGIKLGGSHAQIFFQVLVITALIFFLISYKGKAGIIKIRQARATGSLNLPLLHQRGSSSAMSAARDTGAYLKIIWPALLFGVLISAAALTSLSRTPVHSLFGRGLVRDQVTAALAGMPLMLCSCCVAPLFPTIYQRIRRVAPALAVTLAAPSLNPVALTLSFALFPLRVAGARLGMALALVLIGAAFVASVSGTAKLPVNLGERGHTVTWQELLHSYLKSLVQVALKTIPLIIIGIWISMVIMNWVPLNTLVLTVGGRVLAIGLVALVAVLITLPSLFEIPIALTILGAGGPMGAAAAVLFAGPAINLSSLLVISRHSSWKVGVSLACVVWAIAATGGLLIR